jgi:signal transduction histidine kinase
MPSSLLNDKTGSTAVRDSAGPTDPLENLRRLDRLDRLANLGLVAANAAHEIKNSLVAINTFVELLSQKGEEPEMAEMVQRELRRINGLVTQMLRFAAPKPAAFAAVSVHELIGHSLRLLEHQMTGQTIVLKRNFLANPDKVIGDESQLQQTFMNLLLNAVEAIGNEGEISVATASVKDSQGRPRLNISIRDSGPGIAPENLPHLFEPFFTTKKEGTGLGLAICQHAIEAHRGTIEVQSEPGRGTTFIISLPAE